LQQRAQAIQGALLRSLGFIVVMYRCTAYEVSQDEISFSAVRLLWTRIRAQGRKMHLPAQAEIESKLL
jgi:hypothetical protein